MIFIERYHINKTNYNFLDNNIKGGGAHTTDKIQIIKELGEGMLAITYLVSINGVKYALKRQKVKSKEPKEIRRELKFYKWIDSLDSPLKKFFMILHDHMIYKCDFNFVSKNEKVNNMIRDYEYCSDFILELKDGTLDILLDTVSLSKKEFLSISIQILYAIYLMHNAGYHHLDLKPENIAYKRISKKSYIKIMNHEIPSYGYQISLIDYGSVLHSDFDLNDFEKNKLSDAKKYNVDLNIIIGYLFLNERFIYKQKKINNFKQKFIVNMFRDIYKNRPKRYNTAKLKYMEIYPDDINIKDWENVIEHDEDYEIHKTMTFIMMRLYGIYYGKDLWEYVNIKYIKPPISKKLMLYTMQHYNNIDKIIDNFISIINK